MEPSRQLTASGKHESAEWFQLCLHTVNPLFKPLDIGRINTPHLAARILGQGQFRAKIKEATLNDLQHLSKLDLSRCSAAQPQSRVQFVNIPNR